MENSLSLTWNLRFYGLMSRVTLQPHTCGIQTGPFHSGKKLCLQQEISSIAGEGYSRYFCSTRQLSQQEIFAILATVQARGFPGK